MTAGQVQREAVEAAADPSADLEQPQAQGVELEVRMATVRQPAAQGIEQPIGRRMQDQPEVVGAEATIAQPVGVAGAFEVFYP